MISVPEFMRYAFPHDLVAPDTTPMVSWPASFVNDQGTQVDFYAQRAWHPRMSLPDGAGWLFCVSTVQKARKIRRRLDEVRHAFVLPCDDVGTKCSAPPVAPSYILETSKDNFQYGYFIDPYDVSTPEGAAFYDACLMGLARAGYNDFGCRSASRVVKLPGATHRRGFITQVKTWAPERSWSLDELMSEMGVEPAIDVARNTRRRVPGKHSSLDAVADPVLEWLHGKGLVLDSVSGEWVDVICPWAALHSDTEDVVAGYSPLNFITEGRAFNCFHSHTHGTKEFLAWAVNEGCTSIDPTFDRLRNISNV